MRTSWPPMGMRFSSPRPYPGKVPGDVGGRRAICPSTIARCSGVSGAMLKFPATPAPLMRGVGPIIDAAPACRQRDRCGAGAHLSPLRDQSPGSSRGARGSRAVPASPVGCSVACSTRRALRGSPESRATLRAWSSSSAAWSPCRRLSTKRKHRKQSKSLPVGRLRWPHTAHSSCKVYLPVGNLWITCG